MATIFSWSMSNISVIPGAAFTVYKNNRLTKCSLSRKPAKHTLFSQRPLLPLPSFIASFPKSTLLHRSSVFKLSATGTDVAVEESDLPVVDEDSAGASDAVETSESPPDKSGASPAPAQSRRTRPTRKSEMPPVKDEDLVPGAMFTGKVRSIQPFGAFVDIGAFTEGLVHISRLSDGYVKDVTSVVSVGQEVKVRLVEVNTENRRISLSMRERDDVTKSQQQKAAPTDARSDKPMPSKRNTSKSGQRKQVKSSKFVQGQELEGTVKNLTRTGAFISLPEGEEGFLPSSEESNSAFSMMEGSSLKVGEEVSVRVLRVARGQVTLTMKKEQNNDLDDFVYDEEFEQTGSNPFVLAFRQNKEIAAFLDEREKVRKAKKKLDESKPAEVVAKVDQAENVSHIPKVQDQPAISNEAFVSNEISSGEVVSGSGLANDYAESQTTESSSLQTGDVETMEKEAEESSAILGREGNAFSIGEITEEAHSTDLAENVEKVDSNVEIASKVISSESPVSEESAENQLVAAVPKDEVQIKTTVAGDKISSTAPVAGDESAQALDSNVEIAREVVSSESPAGEKAEVASSASKVISSEIPVSEETAENQPDVTASKDEVQIKTTVAGDEISSTAPVAGDESAQALDSIAEIAKEFASSESPAGKKTAEIHPEVTIPKDEKQIETPIAGGEISSAAPVEESVTGTNPDENGSISGSGQLDSSPSETQDGEVSAESVVASGDIGENTMLSSESKTAEDIIENKVVTTDDEVEKQAPAAGTEISSATEVDTPDNNGSVGNANGQSDSPQEERVTKATISPALVKQLREETGAGMMDCKKALSETGGDIVKAQEFLRKKGLASAEKKASRTTAEGRIGSYIHDSRIGVLIEVNCETDFVSRGDIFKELVDDLAMQVAACPQVQYLVPEDVPEDIVNKEREIEMQKEDLLSRPEQIRSKIVEGRIGKRLGELALLEQPYIKNDKIVVKDLVKQTIATIGENIKVKRFVRYNLGEGLEKKSQDFAAEVAAQTSAKPAAAPATEQSAAAEIKETTPKTPAVAVSAALVKQLREETGAGMMDCKKALSETGGDLEKAQEYLRKKGLLTADKKASRLAAEGRIGSYIHDSRIGVLIEVNCETDFVGRGPIFKELVDDLAMQVVACPQVQFVSIEDIPESTRNKEKELEMQREDILSKPENIREKIVEGRVTKRLGELALLEQPFIKNDTLLVKDLVKQTVASLGENIKVRRFIRFTLGETNEDVKPETEA